MRHAGPLAVVVFLVMAGCGRDQPKAAPAVTSQPATSSSTTSIAPTTATTSTTAPTTTTAPVVTTPLPELSGTVVVLDPGHNEANGRHPSEINQQVDIGNGTKACDTTGTATDGGYTEAEFTTDVASRVAGLLRDAGITVVFTRDTSTPWGPCISRRAAIGNEAHADAAISIHADGGPADGRGFHVIRPLVVAGYNDNIIEPSRQLALAVRDTFSAATGLPFSNYLGSDGVDARDDLGGLNLSTVPKVFIETGNLRNATDAALLQDPSFRQQIAAGIADGLIRFVRAT